MKIEEQVAQLVEKFNALAKQNEELAAANEQLAADNAELKKANQDILDNFKTGLEKIEAMVEEKTGGVKSSIAVARKKEPVKLTEKVHTIEVGGKKIKVKFRRPTVYKNGEVVTEVEAATDPEFMKELAAGMVDGKSAVLQQVF